MARKSFFPKFFNFVGWLTGVVVSLAVAFGMIDGILSIRFIPNIVMVIFGWIVVATTLVGVLISLMRLILKTN